MEELYFDWDESKRQSNIKKHGIDFADILNIFYEADTITIPDPRHYDEQRYIALGIDTKTRLVVVVHVYRDEDLIRIISARLADAKEIQQFEQVNDGR